MPPRGSPPPCRPLQRLSAAPGAKGEQLYDWARVHLFQLQPPPWDHWLLIRRGIEKPDEFVYYVVFGPANTALSTLAHVAGQRWTIVTCSEVAKQEVGLDDDEVRRWHGWYPPHHPGHVGVRVSRGDAGAAPTRRRRIGQKGEKCLVRPGRRNVDAIAAPSCCARGMSPA